MRRVMKPNIGNTDRALRIALGLAMLTFALGFAFPNSGWNWLGWIGVVPILTALIRVCPAYSLIGFSTK